MSVKDAVNFITQGDAGIGLDILKQLGDNDNVEAQAEYGYQIYKLNLSTKSHDAFRYLEKAANAKNADACNRLAILHKKGWNTPKSLPKAIDYFRKASFSKSIASQTKKKAAEYGNSKGYHNLGEIYFHDLHDKENAIQWYLKAAEWGLEESIKKLDSLDSNWREKLKAKSTPVIEQPTKAVQSQSESKTENSNMNISITISTQPNRPPTPKIAEPTKLEPVPVVVDPKNYLSQDDIKARAEEKASKMEIEIPKPPTPKVEKKQKLEPKIVFTNSIYTYDWSCGIKKDIPDEKWLDKGENTYKSFEIFNENSTAHQGLKDYLQNLFEQCFQGPDQYKIVRAYSIDNYKLLNTFENKRDITERRLETEDVFKAKKYSEDSSRKKIIQEFQEKANKFSCNKDRIVKAIPTVHGLGSPEVAWKICQGGMATLSSLDAGWYGAGMYFTTYSKYALSKYAKLDKDGYQVILICWVLYGNPYPVTESPADNSKSLLGKKITAPHDANLVLVGPDGKPSQKQPFFDEICIDQEAQVLPRFVLFLKKK